MTSHFTDTTKNRRWSYGKQRLKRCIFRRLRKNRQRGCRRDVWRQTVQSESQACSFLVSWKLWALSL